MARDNYAYYFDLAEGRWNGRFRFRIKDLSGFFRAPIGIVDRTLALILHVNDKLPGETIMRGEIRGDPDEDIHGVARVEVSVHRLGFEIYRLQGHYALNVAGDGVEIHIYQRFGPHGFPLDSHKLGSAVVDRGGYHAVYTIGILGVPWTGDYEINDAANKLDARYRSDWGFISELMHRLSEPVPRQGTADRVRWERLLEVARRLEVLNTHYDERDDPRAVFAHAYADITRDFAYRLGAMRFDDPDWVVLLAERFAGHFFDAMREYESGAAPRAWTTVLDPITKQELTAVDQFILSMLVHITHDLPYALGEVGMQAPDGQSRIQDFHRVNLLLRLSIDRLQRRLAEKYNPVFGLLDGLLGRYDEMISAYGIGSGRALAWYNAERLLDPIARYDAISSINRSVAKLVGDVVGQKSLAAIPTGILRRTARLLRRRPRFPESKAKFALRRALIGELENDADPALSTAYALHTEIAASRNALDLDGLAQGGGCEARIAQKLDGIVRPKSWTATVAQALRARPEARFSYASLLADLLKGDELIAASRAIGVGPAQLDAIVDFGSLARRAQKEAWDVLAPSIDAVRTTLEALGVPSELVLFGYDDVEAEYDTASDVFSSTVSVLFRVGFDRVKHIIDPEDWDETITQVVDTHYIDPPTNSIIYEEVNVLHPWFEDHPLRLRNHLAVEVREALSHRRVDYRLHESLDGTFGIDEGFIRAEAKGTDHTLVTVQKRIKIKDNPLLYAMLRYNPNGLGALLSSWIGEAAKTGTPS